MSEDAEERAGEFEEVSSPSSILLGGGWFFGICQVLAEIVTWYEIKTEDNYHSLGLERVILETSFDSVAVFFAGLVGRSIFALIALAAGYGLRRSGHDSHGNAIIVLSLVAILFVVVNQGILTFLTMSND